jgi:uncharacterized membrane protein YebE (DUF533 family)
MNPFDILGAVMQAGMSPSSGNRMGSVLGQMMGSMMGGGAPGANPMPGGAPGGGGVLDAVTKMAGSMMGGGQPGGAPGTGGFGGLSGDLLKNVAGAVLGSAIPGGNTAAGMGSLAIFGTLAAKALEMAKTMVASGGAAPAAAPAGPPGAGMDNLSAILAGLRAPATPEEHRQALDMASLTLRAMMNAAKADGRLDDREKAKLLGKLQEGGVTAEEQRFVEAEMALPIDIDELVRYVPNEQAAAQIYTASLMAIKVDTDSERRYLADLAGKLKLDPNAVVYLHQAVGVA